MESVERQFGGAAVADHVGVGRPAVSVALGGWRGAKVASGRPWGPVARTRLESPTPRGRLQGAGFRGPALRSRGARRDGPTSRPAGLPCGASVVASR